MYDPIAVSIHVNKLEIVHNSFDYTFSFILYIQCINKVQNSSSSMKIVQYLEHSP